MKITKKKIFNVFFNVLAFIIGIIIGILIAVGLVLIVYFAFDTCTGGCMASCSGCFNGEISRCTLFVLIPSVLLIILSLVVIHFKLKQWEDKK